MDRPVSEDAPFTPAEALAVRIIDRLDPDVQAKLIAYLDNYQA